jgi:hypothetical protein
MSEQLKVDLGKLGDLSVVLSRLHNELGDLPNHVDSYVAAMGHQGLADATGTMGDDWNNFRSLLMTDIDTLGTFAEEAKNAYQDTDADLSRMINDVMNPAPMPLHGRYHAEL